MNRKNPAERRNSSALAGRRQALAAGQYLARGGLAGGVALAFLLIVLNSSLPPKALP